MQAIEVQNNGLVTIQMVRRRLEGLQIMMTGQSISRSTEGRLSGKATEFVFVATEMPPFAPAFIVLPGPRKGNIRERCQERNGRVGMDFWEGWTVELSERHDLVMHTVGRRLLP